MIVEELVSKLGLEIDDQALRNLQKFKDAITSGLAGTSIALGALGAGLIAAIVTTSEAADEADNMAQKFNVSTDAIQEFKHAATMGQADLAQIGTAFKIISKNAVLAAEGNEEAAKIFGGISIKKANGEFRAADDLFMELVDKFNKLPPGVRQTDFALKAFGKTGEGLIPFLKKGRAGIEEFRREAHKLGVVLSEDVIKAAGKIEDAQKRMNAAFRGVIYTIAEPFITDFADGLESVAAFLIRLRPYVDKFGEGLREITATIVSLLSPLGKLVMLVADWFSNTRLAKFMTFLDGFSLFKALLLGLGTVATLFGIKMAAAGLASAAAWVAALLPFIIMGTVIGLIVDEIYNYIEGNDTILARTMAWAELFNPSDNFIIRFFKSAFALLFDFTDGKHWQKFLDAGQMVMTTIMSIFIQGIRYVSVFLVESIGLGINKLLNMLPAGAKTLLGKVGVDLTPSDNPFAVSDMEANGFAPLLNQLNPFSKGGGASPDASAAIAASPATGAGGSPKVEQTNTFNISGLGLNKEEVEETLKDHHEKTMRQAHAAVKGG